MAELAPLLAVVTTLIAALGGLWKWWTSHASQVRRENARLWRWHRAASQLIRAHNDHMDSCDHAPSVRIVSAVDALSRAQTELDGD